METLATLQLPVCHEVVTAWGVSKASIRELPAGAHSCGIADSPLLGASRVPAFLMRSPALYRPSDVVWRPFVLLQRDCVHVLCV